MFELLTNLAMPAILLLLALVIGRLTERRHITYLKRREDALAAIPVTDLKTFQANVDPTRHAMLVHGEAVIATDYLKSFLSRLRKLIGGELHSYESLMVRARRQVVVRLQEQAKRKGHNALCNVRYYTADIGGGSRRKGSAMSEVVGTATAYTIQSEASRGKA